MKRYLFIFLQILLFASLSHAEVTLAPPIGLRNIFRNIGRMVQSPPSLSGLSQSLFALPFVSKFASLLREGVVKSEEIEAEAERRRNTLNDFLKREKTFQELHQERQKRIKELKQKIEEAHYSPKQTKEGETIEEMQAELIILQGQDWMGKMINKEKGTESEETLSPGSLAPKNSGGATYAVPHLIQAPGQQVGQETPQAKAEGGESGESGTSDDETDGSDPDPDLCCIITLELMTEPFVASDGHTYEGCFIKPLAERGEASPATREALEPILYPNYALAKIIDSKYPKTRAVAALNRAKGKPMPSQFYTDAVSKVLPTNAGRGEEPAFEAKDVGALEWWLVPRRMTFREATESISIHNRSAGWRLPTIWELYALRMQNNNPDMNFPLTKVYWSSTPNIKNVQLHWRLAFRNGFINSWGRANNYYVLYVRDRSRGCAAAAEPLDTPATGDCSAFLEDHQIGSGTIVDREAIERNELLRRFQRERSLKLSQSQEPDPAPAHHDPRSDFLRELERLIKAYNVDLGKEGVSDWTDKRSLTPEQRDLEDKINQARINIIEFLKKKSSGRIIEAIKNKSKKSNDGLHDQYRQWLTNLSAGQECHNAIATQGLELVARFKNMRI